MLVFTSVSPLGFLPCSQNYQAGEMKNKRCSLDFSIEESVSRCLLAVSYSMT